MIDDVLRSPPHGPSTQAPDVREGRRALSTRARSVGLIILCQVASMTLWFSASAAVPNLIETGQISYQQGSLLTGAVQLGFVVGTIASALWCLSDRIDPRRLFAACAATGAAVNCLLLWTGFDSAAAVILRGLTGMCMAGVYPVGMKLAAGWSNRNMGLMIGVLVGALTLGSALPHLFNALSPLDWRITIATASACAFIGALMINLVKTGPGQLPASKLELGLAFRSLKRRSIRLANFGYLGHMWELYAMWAWIGPFFDWSLKRQGHSQGNPALMTFLVVSSGAVGCVVAGAVADRIGRTTVTISAMVVSAACAATIGLWADAGAGMLLAVAVVWGVTIVADSAQFSAAIAELSEPRLVGTMLTLQTCMGFLLTFVTIQLMPLAIGILTWRYAFAILAIGPLLGAIAMHRLRKDPEAGRLANGQM